MLNTFDDRTTEEIIRVVRANLSRIVAGTPLQNSRSSPRSVPPHYQARITTTITPANGVSPGIGEGEIFRFNTDSMQFEPLFEQPQTIRIAQPVAIHPGVITSIHIDPWGDYWSEPDSSLKYFRVPASGIPKKTVVGHGKALCKLLKLVYDEDDETIKTALSLDADGNQIEQEVYNGASQDVGGVMEIDIQAGIIDSFWVANWEDCSSAQQT